MATLETQYQNFLKKNPESKISFQKWLEIEFIKNYPPQDGLRPIDEYQEELSEWDVTLMDGLENEPPFVDDYFQIGSDGSSKNVE